MKRQLKKYKEKLQELQIELNNDQNADMEKIVSWINKNAASKLENVLSAQPGADPDLAGLLRATWNKDTEDRGQFHRDQFINHGNYALSCTDNFINVEKMIKHLKWQEQQETVIKVKQTN